MKLVTKVQIIVFGLIVPWGYVAGLQRVDFPHVEPVL